MTIGIAATGPWAGQGILAGLRAVEEIGRGAIGGFVSAAVITEERKLLRAETQNGGTTGLFENHPPEAFLRAPFAALISSGPNRPPPLSLFVAAAPDVGIVTGHRFPQVKGTDGVPLNEAILAAIKRGNAPQRSIDDVIAALPGFDAGFVALALDGNVGLGNMPSVLRRADQGAAIEHCADIGASVAILHNAIHPHNAVSVLAKEITLDQMQQSQKQLDVITVTGGVALRHGSRPEIHVNQALQTTEILHPEALSMSSEGAFGLGDRVSVLCLDQPLGWLDHEPFMVVKNGVVVTLDGKDEIELPVRKG